MLYIVFHGLENSSLYHFNARGVYVINVVLDGLAFCRRTRPEGCATGFANLRGEVRTTAEYLDAGAWMLREPRDAERVSLCLFAYRMAYLIYQFKTGGFIR